MHLYNCTCYHNLIVLIYQGQLVTFSIPWHSICQCAHSVHNKQAADQNVATFDSLLWGHCTQGLHFCAFNIEVITYSTDYPHTCCTSWSSYLLRACNVTKLALWGFHIHQTGSIPKLCRLDLVSPKQSGRGLVITMAARMCVCSSFMLEYLTKQVLGSVFSNDCKKISHGAHIPRTKAFWCSYQQPAFSLCIIISWDTCARAPNRCLVHTLHELHLFIRSQSDFVIIRRWC